MHSIRYGKVQLTKPNVVGRTRNCLYPVNCSSKFKNIFSDALILYIFSCKIRIYNCWDELTDMSAKTETLLFPWKIRCARVSVYFLAEMS